MVKERASEKSENEEIQTKEPYPKSVFFIIGNEFCERFSYYGMRTILILYLTQILLYGPDTATVIFHAFTVACYCTPILGAIISDSWLGKFRTILYISIIYAIGNIVISFSSMPQPINTMAVLSLIGLGLIALGTGGIKPCVSAFGGDQFKPGQERYRERFFSFFYLSINLGSTISTFLTPILRHDVHCFGQTSCFPLAFGVPAILMLTSLGIFIFGKPTYKIIPPEGNVLAKVVKCCGHAISNKYHSKVKNKGHWLEYADDKYDTKFIKEIQTVLRVLCLFIPLPVFWALFDQQGSRWTLQATKMSGKMFGWTMQPDQMQVVNPFLIIILIPTFEYCVYPLLNKCHLLQKPLQRITVGGLIAAVSFVYAGFLEMHLESNFPEFPSHGMSDLSIINNSPCDISIGGTLNGTKLNAFDKTPGEHFTIGTEHLWNLQSEKCSDLKSTNFEFVSLHPIETVMITTMNGEIKVMNFEDTWKKSAKGLAKVRILYGHKNGERENTTVSFHLEGKKTYYLHHESDLNYGVTDYIDVNPDIYTLYSNHTSYEWSLNETSSTKTFDLREGGNYIITTYHDPSSINELEMHAYTIVKPNTISLLYQLPQYILITIGEIMFSITGLEFSYSQAPISMKSVLQAAWLLTVSFGNFIVLIVAEAEIFSKQSYEFFLFAGLMAVDMIIFAFMAKLYKYVKPEEYSEKNANTLPPVLPPPYEKVNPEKTNPIYDEDTKF